MDYIIFPSTMIPRTKMSKQSGSRCATRRASINITTFVCNESTTSACIHIITVITLHIRSRLLTTVPRLCLNMATLGSREQVLFLFTLHSTGGGTFCGTSEGHSAHFKKPQNTLAIF